MIYVSKQCQCCGKCVYPVRWPKSGPAMAWLARLLSPALTHTHTHTHTHMTLTHTHYKLSWNVCMYMQLSSIYTRHHNACMKWHNEHWRYIYISYDEQQIILVHELCTQAHVCTSLVPRSHLYLIWWPDIDCQCMYEMRPSDSYTIY